MAQGIFVGLVTLDFIYLATSIPNNNQKIVANDYTVASGGPATNAAVTFSYLGNQATVLGRLGNHPITQLIRADLASFGVAIADLEPTQSEPPPVSSIIVTQSTGERAVISINANKNQVPRDRFSTNILSNIDIVLIDGHQREISQAIAEFAKSNHIPIVLDGGSWKPGLESLLPLIDYAVCSANFYPPNCHNSEQVFNYLSNVAGISHIAITQGEKPIKYLSDGKTGLLEVSQVAAVDTLGAGDIFHGAFCHYILQNSFTDALSAAAKIASDSCNFFGTRSWMS